MPSSQICPQCGEYDLYRSRSRNLIEKSVKKISPLRTYRCHHCNWRGWMTKQKASGNKITVKTIIFYLFIFIVTLVIAYLLQIYVF